MPNFFQNLHKKIFWGLTVCSMLFVFLAVITNVGVDITPEDKSTFSSIKIPLPVSPPTSSLSFNDQINLIRALQAEVFVRAPFIEGDAGIPLYRPREPKDLFQYQRGLCFDRSRTIDKLLNFYGFKTRHIYILYKNNRSFIRALFSYGHPSHAVTEVMTSKGWMLVDSNFLWVGLTDADVPINAYQTQFNIDKFKNIPVNFHNPYWTIVGFYSKRGQFYKPYLPFPELNWPTFFNWLIND